MTFLQQENVNITRKLITPNWPLKINDQDFLILFLELTFCTHMNDFLCLQVYKLPW